MSQLFLNLAMSSSLKLLWGMMNVLMFIIFMKSWQFSIPAYSGVVIDKLAILVLGEFIPKEELKSYIYGLLGLDEE